MQNYYYTSCSAFVYVTFFGVFVFPGPQPSAWPPAPARGLGPQFVFTGPGPQFVFTGHGPQFVFNGSGLQFVFTKPGPKFVFSGPGPKFSGLAQSEAWACRYQPCPPNLYLLALAYDFYYRALNLHLPSYL